MSESATEELKGPLKQIYDHIEATNAAFKEMTLEQKRVQVAKDVLLQLEVGRMLAFSTYFASPAVENAVYAAMKDHTLLKGDLRDLFKKMPQCQVCGIGALFVAVVDREDDLSLTESVETGGPCNRKTQEYYLAGKMQLFSAVQLFEVERAFENVPGFCSIMDSPRMKMQKIMQRIIEAEGVIDSSTFPRTHAGEYAD